VPLTITIAGLNNTRVLCLGWKVIYRVGVAILTKAHKSGELLTHDSSSILEFLASIGWSAFDCNELITEAFEGFDGQKALYPPPFPLLNA